MDFIDNFLTDDEVDPAAEFLAREQSLLGDLESEIVPQFNTVASFAEVDIPDDDSEMISGESDEVLVISEPPTSRFESEKVRKWREEQKQRLEEKEHNEERQKEELRLKAQKQLEDCQRKKEESIAKTKAALRDDAGAEHGAPIEPFNIWERVANLCDLNSKVSKSGKDVSRMRSIYLDLKKNPLPMRNMD